MINFLSKVFLPFWVIFGIIANLISSIIFSSKNETLKGPYQYLKMNSIVDTVILIIISGASFLFSDFTFDESSFVYSYWYKIYHLYFGLFLGKTLNTLSSGINLKMAFDRLVLLKNQKFKSKFKTC